MVRPWHTTTRNTVPPPPHPATHTHSNPKAFKTATTTLRTAAPPFFFFFFNQTLNTSACHSLGYPFLLSRHTALNYEEGGLSYVKISSLAADEQSGSRQAEEWKWGEQRSGDVWRWTCWARGQPNSGGKKNQNKKKPRNNNTQGCTHTHTHTHTCMSTQTHTHIVCLQIVLFTYWKTLEFE